MIIEIKIPSAGESVTEAAIGVWLAEDGSFVEKNQELAEVESDKATLPLIAPESGILKIIAETGIPMNIGDLACTIDTDQTKDNKTDSSEKLKKNIAKPVKTEVIGLKQPGIHAPTKEKIKVTPLAKNIMDHYNIDVDGVIRGLRRITKRDVELAVKEPSANEHSSVEFPGAAGRQVELKPMSPLRRKLSKRLVAVKNETALLTTFNEVDMSRILDIRKIYQSVFQDKYGIKLGMMSFFIKACAEALKVFPGVNAMMDKDMLLIPGFVDIAVAVQTEKGLMVPVIRDAHLKSLPELELNLNELANKARTNKLSLEEMTGGTFTITNGGVFGSMLSTPIINPPQSAILGMHNIIERPVAIDGKVEIRPVMYIALSYDHRVIDGKDSVSFLLKIKELTETPVKMVMEGNEPERLLLGL